MYIVFKGSRPAGNKKFSTYERARQYARKLARKTATWQFVRTVTPKGYNPAIGQLEYSVRRI